MLTNSANDSWSLINMLQNSENLARDIGGGLLALFGIIAIVWAIVLIFMKLLSENSRRSWMTIIGLFLLGGLAFTGGLTMFTDIASGTQTTVEELGR